MAATAESVVVELVAKIDGYTRDINRAGAATTAAMSGVERSAAQAEATVQRTAASFVTSARQSAAATRNLGRQVQDIGVGLSTGQNPFFIIAQQAPQVADALADTGGRAARVAAFFAGPWGAALLAAGSAVGILVGKMLEGGETIGSLTKKLEANESKSLLAAQADRIFAATQAGLGARIRDTTKALDDQNASLRTSAQLRNVQANAELSSAQADQKRLREERDALKAQRQQLNTGLIGADFRTSGGLRNNAAASAARVDIELKKNADQLRQANINVNRSRVFLARENSTTNATPEGRINKRFDDQINAESRRLIAAAEKGKLVGGATEKLFDTINARREVEMKALADSKKKGPKGPSAEVLARRAEVARIREVRNDEAYQNELEQLNGQIIAAQRARAVTAEQAAQFERAAIESDYRKRNDGIAADLSARKYSEAEATTLRAKNDENRSLRLRGVEIDKSLRVIQEQSQRDLLSLNISEEQARAELSIAETRDERRKIELELIRLKYQERDIQLAALRRQAETKGDKATVGDIDAQRAALPGLKASEESNLAIGNRSQYENYRRDMQSADSLADDIDRIKINTLEAVTDELTNATKAALGLKGAFGDIVGQLIRIGIQRRLIGPIADQLFGKADGSSSGSLGGFFGSVTNLFGRASGGYVAPNSTVRVNEGRGGVELLRMGSQGGSIIPLGQAQAARPAPAAPAVVQLVVGPGQLFEPSVRQISGQVSVQIVQDAAPGIVQAGGQRAIDRLARGQRFAQIP